LFVLLEANPDRRSLARMSAIQYAQIIKGKSMRGWMQKRLSDAIAKLEAHPACGSEPEVARADRDALAALAIEPGKLARRRTGKRSAESELFAAVYEAPDDDGPRLVLADFLLERGDPRGELLSLQLSGARTKDAESRALAIIRKHQKAWMGALSPHLKYFLYPSVAAIDPLGINMWWRRGFLAGCNAMPTKPKLVKLADDPKWSTFERVSSLRYDRKDELDDALRRLFARMRALRVLDATNAYAVTMVAETPTAARLEQVDYYTSLDEYLASLECLAAMPKLRVADVRLHYQAEPTLMPVIASGLLARPALERFAFRNLTLTRTAGGPWSLRIEEATAETTGLVEQLLGADLALAPPTFVKCRLPRREAIERLFANT